MLKYKIEDLLVEDCKVQRGTVKRYLLREGILKNECSICGMGDTWQGKPIIHTLDHENGINNDNREHNLRMVCRNCDSQLPTFTGRNTKRALKEWKCVDCKDGITTGRERCRSCATTHKYKDKNCPSLNYKIDWPDTSMLKKTAALIGFRALGKEIGVSDNAIRKRIKNHDL